MFNFLGGIKKIRKFHAKYQNKRLYRQINQLIEEKINDEEDQNQGLIELTEEETWLKEIESDDEKDNYNLELVEAFNMKTIKANYLRSSKNNILSFLLFIKK